MNLINKVVIIYITLGISNILSMDSKMDDNQVSNKERCKFTWRVEQFCKKNNISIKSKKITKNTVTKNLPINLMRLYGQLIWCTGNPNNDYQIMFLQLSKMIKDTINTMNIAYIRI